MSLIKNRNSDGFMGIGWVCGTRWGGKGWDCGCTLYFSISLYWKPMQRKLGREKRRHSELRPYDCGDRDGLATLLPRAVRLPVFFEENLVDEERTVKVLPDDAHVSERVFYFQLLKLIFEVEQTDYEKYLGKIYDILDNPRVRLLRPRPPHPCHLPLPPSRITKLLDEFLQFLGQGQHSVTDALARFPIVDKALIALMRTILVLAGTCRSFQERVQSQEVYRCLGKYFEVSVSEVGGCVRFDQVDVFAYSEGGTVYVAYLSPPASQSQIVSSSNFYHCDSHQVFNISSVRQMVSQIDLPLEDCFSLTKPTPSETETEHISYDYSRSEERRMSQNETSEIRFSGLQEESQFSLLRSNKVLEKELLMERERRGQGVVRRGFEPIKEVPDVENALSPPNTPRGARFISFGKEEVSLYEKENIYRRKPNKEEDEMVSTGESVFNNREHLRKEKQNLQVEKEGEVEAVELKQHATIKSLYDMRSIKSISCAQTDSYVLPDTPLRSPNPLRSPTRTPTTSDFTSSFVLQQMPPQYQTSIKLIKGRARKERPNVKKLLLF